MGWWPKTKQAKKTRQPQLMAGQDDYIFRRSRTLTGSISSKIRSAAPTTSTHLKSARHKLHELYEVRLRILKSLAWCVFVVGILGFLMLNYVGNFRIGYAQQGSGGVLSQTTAYQTSLGHYFDMHPLERFGFALDMKQLQSYMTQQHSELMSFIVNRAWYGGGVSFAATFRRPILVWQTVSQRFYVDSDGVAFLYNYLPAQLVSVVDQSGITPSSGTSVASRHFIYFLGKMVGALNKGNAGQVNTVTIPASTREIDVKLQGRGYSIKTRCTECSQIF